MIFDPGELDRRELNGLVNNLVAPRPIAWVSTTSAEGVSNLAPFSYFNAFSYVPPTLAIGPGSRKGVNKDTLQNIRATGEFVVCMVTEALAELANRSSADVDADVDEWQILGLEPAPSETVTPPRVAASPAAFECRCITIVDLGAPELPTNSLVIGAVERIHVADDAFDSEGKLEDLALVGRMGGARWCRTTDVFELARPAA